MLEEGDESREAGTEDGEGTGMGWSSGETLFFFDKRSSLGDRALFLARSEPAELLLTFLGGTLPTPRDFRSSHQSAEKASLSSAELQTSEASKPGPASERNLFLCVTRSLTQRTCLSLAD